MRTGGNSDRFPTEQLQKEKKLDMTYSMKVVEEIHNMLPVQLGENGSENTVNHMPTFLVTKYL